jgi:hypothetical protein
VIDVGEQVGESVVQRHLPAGGVAAQAVALVHRDLQLVDELGRAVRVGERVALGRELRLELRDRREHFRGGAAHDEVLALRHHFVDEIPLELREPGFAFERVVVRVLRDASQRRRHREER